MCGEITDSLILLRDEGETGKSAIVNYFRPWHLISLKGALLTIKQLRFDQFKDFILPDYTTPFRQPHTQDFLWYYYKEPMRKVVAKVCPAKVPTDVQELILDELLYMQYRRKNACTFDFLCVAPIHLETGHEYLGEQPNVYILQHIGTVLVFDKCHRQSFESLKVVAQKYFAGGKYDFLPRPLYLFANNNNTALSFWKLMMQKQLSLRSSWAARMFHLLENAVGGVRREIQRSCSITCARRCSSVGGSSIRNLSIGWSRLKRSILIVLGIGGQEIDTTEQRSSYSCSEELVKLER